MYFLESALELGGGHLVMYFLESALPFRTFLSRLDDLVGEQHPCLDYLLVILRVGHDLGVHLCDRRFQNGVISLLVVLTKDSKTVYCAAHRRHAVIVHPVKLFSTDEGLWNLGALTEWGNQVAVKALAEAASEVETAPILLRVGGGRIYTQVVGKERLQQVIDTLRIIDPQILPEELFDQLRFPRGEDPPDYYVDKPGSFIVLLVRRGSPLGVKTAGGLFQFLFWGQRLAAIIEKHGIYVNNMINFPLQPRGENVRHGNVQLLQVGVLFQRRRHRGLGGDGQFPFMLFCGSRFEGIFRKQEALVRGRNQPVFPLRNDERIELHAVFDVIDILPDDAQTRHILQGGRACIFAGNARTRRILQGGRARILGRIR